MRTAALVLAMAGGLLLTRAAPGARGQEWAPEILDGKSDLYLPDWSYAGYRWGEGPLPETPVGAVLDVTRFGAHPDDEADDTAAIRKALAAAHALEGPVVVRFAPGRYIVREILWIRRGHLALVGAGSGEGGTVLAMPRPMAEMQLPPEFEKTRQYLVKNNKRVRGKLFSLFSWSGGILWTQLPERHTRHLGAAVGGTRGGHVVTLGTPVRIEPGTIVRLTWKNPDGPDGSLLTHVFGGHALEVGQRLYENPDRKLIGQELTVVAVRGREVVVKEPLMHDVRPAWQCGLETRDWLREVGLQGFRVEFPDTEYAGHHTEAGYNAIYLQDLAHGWVRDVAIHNADSGILSDGCVNVTVAGVRCTGRAAHYCVLVGNCRRVLVRNFDFQAPALHCPSFNTGAQRCVFTHGRVHEARLDQHCGLNHQNLFDDLQVTCGRARDLFRHGGAGYWKPTAGAFNTFWNVCVTLGEGGKTGLKDAPAARIVGLVTDPPIELDYGPGAYIEGLNRPGLAVPSLYEYQLKARLKGGR